MLIQSWIEARNYPDVFGPDTQEVKHISSYQHYFDKTIADPKEVKPNPKTIKVKKVKVEKLENFFNETKIKQTVEVESSVKVKEKVEAMEAFSKSK